MAKAVIVVLADEVTDDLNKKKGTWAATFDAERRFQPKLDFENTDQLQVQVVPMAWTKAPDSRAEWKHDYTIAIGLHYRAGPKAGDQAKEKFDTLLKLVEEISDHYEDTRPTFADCVLMEIAFGGGTGLPYAHEVIETQNQFTSVIHLTFRKYR